MVTVYKKKDKFLLSLLPLSDPQLYGDAWEIGPTVLHPMVLLFVLSGSLMISKTLRIPKF